MTSVTISWHETLKMTTGISQVRSYPRSQVPWLTCFSVTIMECEILWYINVSVYKDCPDTAAVCTLHLVIVQDENEIQIHPDLSVGFNGYRYNIQQVCVILIVAYPSSDLHVFLCLVWFSPEVAHVGRNM
jgi:hypothetical protein